MKTLKSILFGIAIMAVATVANAKSIKGELPFSSDYVLKTYVAATTQGNLAGFDKTLTNDATFNIVQGERSIKMDKAKMVASLKATEGIVQDCKVTTSLVSQTLENTVYEVDTKFSDYTNVNMITLVANDQDGWKISNIQTTMKNS